MRCKACNVELKAPRDRDVEGTVMIEDLCGKCLELAYSAVFNRDLSDDDMFELEILGGLNVFENPEGRL